MPYPEELAFGMGLNGKYLLLWPSRNLTIVTLGNSFGTSLGCEAAYDDGFTLSLVWRALAPALEEVPRPPPPIPPPLAAPARATPAAFDGATAACAAPRCRDPRFRGSP